MSVPLTPALSRREKRGNREAVGEGFVPRAYALG